MMRWLDGVNDSMDMSLSKLQKIEEDRGVWHAEVQRVRDDFVIEQQKTM